MAPRKRLPRRPPSVELDDIDRKILNYLLDDARMTNRELAQLIDVAPSTALVRTRKLQENGIIYGHEAKVNLAAIGRPVQALIAVNLRAHDRQQIDQFTSRMSQRPEVLSTFHTSGTVDYIVHLAVATTDDLRDWVLDYLTTDSAVSHTETTLVFEQIPGHRGPLPDETEKD